MTRSVPVGQKDLLTLKGKVEDGDSPELSEEFRLKREEVLRMLDELEE